MRSCGSPVGSHFGKKESIVKEVKMVRKVKESDVIEVLCWMLEHCPSATVLDYEINEVHWLRLLGLFLSAY